MLFRQFEKLLTDLNSLNAPKQVNTSLTSALNFLRSESLAHSDRRGKIEDTRRAWLIVQSAFKTYDPEGKLRNSPEFYEAINKFVRHDEATSTSNSVAILSVAEAFKAMLKATSKVRGALDAISIRESLLYLMEQQKWKSSGRSQDEVERVWRKVQPLLRKHRILDEFDREPIRTEIKDFIKGKI